VKVDEVKSKTGKEKCIALNNVITNVSETINRIYTQDMAPSEQQSAGQYSYQPLSEYARYMMEFDDIEQAERFSKVVQRLPIVDSTLYKDKGRFYLIAGLMSADESIIYDMRRAGVEYSKMLTVNAPEAMFIEEHGECIIRDDAIIHLADLAK
jgi:negative regulator of genetic competence, sporulation and motility